MPRIVQLDRIISFCTAGFVLGGATIVAGSMWRWAVTGNYLVTRGTDRHEGQITLILGLTAIMTGVLLTIVHSARTEVLCAGAGCAIAGAVITFAFQIISEYEAAGNIMGYLSIALAEGPWILLAGGAAVGLTSLVCLAHGLLRLTFDDARQRA
jgi:hypothetical protein